jgi:hypothetical protein
MGIVHIYGETSSERALPPGGTVEPDWHMCLPATAKPPALMGGGARVLGWGWPNTAKPPKHHPWASAWRDFLSGQTLPRFRRSAVAAKYGETSPISGGCCD